MQAGIWLFIAAGLALFDASMMGHVDFLDVLLRSQLFPSGRVAARLLGGTAIVPASGHDPGFLCDIFRLRHGRPFAMLADALAMVAGVSMTAHGVWRTRRQRRWLRAVLEGRLPGRIAEASSLPSGGLPLTRAGEPSTSDQFLMAVCEVRSAGEEEAFLSKAAEEPGKRRVLGLVPTNAGGEACRVVDYGLQSTYRMLFWMVCAPAAVAGFGGRLGGAHIRRFVLRSHRVAIAPRRAPRERAERSSFARRPAWSWPRSLHRFRVAPRVRRFSPQSSQSAVHGMNESHRVGWSSLDCFHGGAGAGGRGVRELQW